MLPDLLICLRFFSRLPVPTTRRETALGARGLPRAVGMVPVAGAIVGSCAALALAAATVAGLPSPVAASLAVAVLVIVSGALHEDGLADCADGFGGGRTREGKLAIMRDSRIGTFGACALTLSLSLRAASLAAILDHGAALAAAVAIAGAALSRTLCLLPLVLLPSARPDGAGAAMGAIDRRRFVLALALAFALAFLPLLGGASVLRALTGCLAAVAGAATVCAIARRQIGGQTGDVAGAAQQVAEIAMLIVFAGSAP